jgi:Ni/Co efflux regulator RcnB
MRKLVLTLAAASMALPVIPAASAAEAQGYYYNGHYYHGRTWRDDRGRTRCRKPNGTVGLIVGGPAGALVGRAIDTHGERTTGTVLGAAAGALLGRKVARDSGSRRYECR